MKILSITTQKPHSTGSGIYLTELVRSFARDGHRQAVVAGLYRDDETHFPAEVSFFPVFYTHHGETPADIPYPVLGMSDIMPYEATRYNELTDAMAEELREAFTSQIRSAVDALDPDLILCHHLYLLTSMVKEIAGDRPVFGLSHGSDLRQFSNCPFHRDAIAAGIRQLDGIFALHEAQAEQITELFSYPSEKITVVGSGYNAQRFTPEGRISHGEVRELIYAGKLSREKGLFPLFDALTELSEDSSLPPFRLSLAGGCRDDEIRARLTGQEDAPLTPGALPNLPFPARYLGILTQPELADSFRQSDLFVLPSYYEGLPLVLIEAMACGVRPVCTDLPGVRPWIDSVTEGGHPLYVTPPQMLRPGVPEESAIPTFRSALRDALHEALCAPHSAEPADTSRASWDGVAATLLARFAEIFIQTT